MTKVIDFLRDVKIELSKVTWPTGSLTVQYTVVVIATSIVVAVFLGALDVGFKALLQLAL